MVKTYRSAHQWDHWLTHFLGRGLLKAEQEVLAKLLGQCFGRHSLLIGTPHQDVLLKSCVTTYQCLLTPLVNNISSVKVIEGEFYELPILSASMDVVLLPHSLEYVDNPRQLLTEACRIVKPEGYIVVLGFNPFSLWGLKKLFNRTHHAPWSRNFISAGTIKTWLGFADFELAKQDMLLFRPPLSYQGLYHRLAFMEWIGGRCFKPLGGVYVMVAKAKVISLTPIRLRWQQRLSGAQVTIPGPTMRDY